MLKRSLRELLASYRASHKSVPQLGFIAVDITFQTGYPGDGGTWPSYTAPADGVCVIQLNNNPSLCIRKRNMDFADSNSATGAWAVCYVPCKKGEVVNWYSNNTASAPTTAYLRFYPDVGS